MLFKILYIIKNFFQSLTEHLEEIVYELTDKIQTLIKGCLDLILVFPFYLIKEFLGFILDFFKMNKKLIKNYAVFKKWYDEYRDNSKKDD